MTFQPSLPFDAEPEEVKIPEGGFLLDSLAGVCRDRPLEEKVLIAPSLLIGHELAERVARAGTPWINLRVETVRTLAHALVARDLAREGRRLLSRAQALALVEQACAQALGEDSYFGFLSDRPGLHRAVQSALDELRAAGVGPDRLPAGAFGDRRKHRALQETFRRHEEALEAGRYVDRAEVLRRAEAVLAPTPSSEGPIYLLPGSTVLSPLERRFLERLAGQRLIALSEGPPDVWKQIARRARLLRASGEENELRAAFRRILKDGIPFDEVEILHTDKAVYPALAWELSREHQIPCTFSEGVLASYTRPGRAAIAFLEWIGQDFAAERLRLALASGAIGLSGAGVEGAAAAREAARGLREAEIGWGRDRHRKCLDRLVEELEQPEPSRRGDDEASPELRARRARARQRRLAAARLARDFARRALDLAPFSPDGPGDLASLARGVRTFVQEFARVADPLDATAREALETLLSELEELDAPRSSLADSVERLRDAVTRLSVAADRPRPGRVHVAFYGAGGFSGRRQTFLVGLDAARHPGPDVEDPILLDEERRRINQELPEAALGLHRERPHEAAAALWSCVGRLTGALDASYSSFGLRNLSQAGEPAPSAAFLELHRARCGRPEADYEDLLESMTEAVGFVPLPDDALDETEWWLAQARRLPPGSAAPQVEQRHPWLADGERARLARESPDFTVWDGWIRSGTPELDPRSNGRPISASRIQKLAGCPFAFFLQNVLKLEPADDPERHPARWLEPMDEGTLLHETFRIFFDRITQAGEKPEAARHGELLEAIAAEQIAAWRERVPPRSRMAFEAQRDNVLFACRTLLRMDEGPCRLVTPRYFEVPFGLDRAGEGAAAAVGSLEPVSIPLGGRQAFLLRGSIDRVDQAPDGSYHVWDYKTGSPYNVREGAGLRGGRQIQPELYAMAFDALLERAGLAGLVSSAGYFFPGRKGEGLRIEEAPNAGPAREVLRRLFNLLEAGMFPHAVSPEDCRHCDFESICGGSERASEQAKKKLAGAENATLASFREIHDAER